MNRRLVLTNEAAGHPFRRTIPVSALAVAEERAAPEPKWTGEDTRLFLLSFAAFFTAISFFIM